MSSPCAPNSTSITGLAAPVEGSREKATPAPELPPAIAEHHGLHGDGGALQIVEMLRAAGRRARVRSSRSGRPPAPRLRAARSPRPGRFRLRPRLPAVVARASRSIASPSSACSLAAPSFGDDLRQADSSNAGYQAEHDMGVAFEEAAPAVPGKARIAAHSRQAVHRRGGAADVDYGIEHAGHRARRARAHRYQQRVAPAAESPAGRCSRKAMPSRRPAATCALACASPAAIAAHSVIGSTKAGGTGSPSAAMCARLAALAPMISAECSLFEPSPMRTILHGPRPLRRQVGQHVPVEQVAETRQPVGRPLQRAGELERRQRRFEIEIAAQDCCGDCTFDAVGFVFERRRAGRWPPARRRNRPAGRPARRRRRRRRWRPPRCRQARRRRARQAAPATRPPGSSGISEEMKAACSSSSMASSTALMSRIDGVIGAEARDLAARVDGDLVGLLLDMLARAQPWPRGRMADALAARQ